jgi:hypothetical protein
MQRLRTVAGLLAAFVCLGRPARADEPTAADRPVTVETTAYGGYGSDKVGSRPRSEPACAGVGLRSWRWPRPVA